MKRIKTLSSIYDGSFYREKSIHFSSFTNHVGYLSQLFLGTEDAHLGLGGGLSLILVYVMAFADGSGHLMRGWKCTILHTPWRYTKLCFYFCCCVKILY